MDPVQYQQYTTRLQASLESRSDIQALVVLGSAATGPDQWSDHDFFVITDPGCQEKYRQDLSWIPGKPLFFFRDTAHGLKVFIEPDHLLDFAVFDPGEIFLSQVTAYAVVFDKTGVCRGFPEIQQMTVLRSQTQQAPLEVQWGRLLFQLFTAFQRNQRGEKLSAHSLARAKSLDTLLRLLYTVSYPEVLPKDIMDLLRGAEQALPQWAGKMAKALEQDIPGVISGFLELCSEAVYPHLSPEQRQWGEWLRSFIQV